MSKGPSIAITGAGGFVGSHLAEGLARLGHAIVATDRQFAPTTRTRLEGCDVIEGELNAALARRAFAGCDVLVHGAALTTSPKELGITGAEHIKHNVDLLLDALDAAEQAGIAMIVFLSSSGVFAPCDGGDATTEDTLPTAEEPYALAKRIGETIVAARDGLSLRLGPIYGPHETVRPSRTGLSLVCRLIDAASAPRPLVVETPDRRRDWTYAPDLARALARLLTQKARGVLHCGSGEIVSDFDLARMIAGPRAAGSIVLEKTSERSKAPMTSVRPELAGFDWTPLAAGLASLMARPVLEVTP